MQRIASTRKKGIFNECCENKYDAKRRKNTMNTSMKENNMMELNPNDMENVCGSGVITGFFNPYSAPGRKSQKDKTGNEQKDQ